jgi:hypothetical protein
VKVIKSKRSLPTKPGSNLWWVLGGDCTRMTGGEFGADALPAAAKALVRRLIS